MDQALLLDEEKKESLFFGTEALTAVCQLVATLYRFVLKEDMVQRLLDINAQSNEEDFILENKDCAEGLLAMQEYCRKPDLASLLLEASKDYHGLFVGPSRLLAPPWSSVYMDSRGTIFGPTARKVKSVFLEQGFVIPEGTTEPSDHVAYEWQFIADLQKRILLAWKNDEDNVVSATVSVLCDFFDSCFNPWIGEFCSKVTKNAKTDFYRGLSQFSVGLWVLEQDIIKGLRVLVLKPEDCGEEKKA